ncbi:hypothetical protein PIB30_084308 [Stylosanthes scabra]|uniref:Uncharacterized protein n=1 Tax=Stylosanthes scabra TaxID=79078 RepID=A0ABU6TUG0_9FABA|nr:hypothetical protein [Stylosanthes scabra]
MRCLDLGCYITPALDFLWKLQRFKGKGMEAKIKRSILELTKVELEFQSHQAEHNTNQCVGFATHGRQDEEGRQRSRQILSGKPWLSSESFWDEEDDPYWGYVRCNGLTMQDLVMHGGSYMKF